MISMILASFKGTLGNYVFYDLRSMRFDYANLNFALSQSPDSMFRQRRVVNLRTKNGYRALTDEVYREVIDGKRTERKLARKRSCAAERKIRSGYFGSLCVFK